MAESARTRRSDAASVRTSSPSAGAGRILFDIGHPAQVHLFRNAIAELDRAGHDTFVTSRVKEVTVELLDAYGIEHTALTTRGDSFPGLLWELGLREKRLLAFARRTNPDVIVSRLSPAAAHVSALIGCQHVVVSDTKINSRAMRLLNYRLTLPFVDTICVPESFVLPVNDDRRQPMDFQELAYLHPQFFTPDPAALRTIDIDPDEPFFVIRLAGWDAYHDVGHAGLSPGTTRALVTLLSEYGEVYLSAEGELPPDLEPHRLSIPPEAIHNVLAHAVLYVGDSGTMSTEAAMVGTPSVRINTMVSDADENVFRELEDRYGLLWSFADEQRALKHVRSLLDSGLDSADWHMRRERLLADQPNVTQQLVDVITKSIPTHE